MSTYVPESSYPLVTPTATIYIEGLLGLCFKGQERCTVAFNKQMNHVPVFEVYKRTSAPPPNDCVAIIKALPAAQRIEIKVTRSGTRTNAVKVYNGSSPVGSGSHRHNFVENCVDMEGVRGHRQPVKNKTASLWPRVYIDDGLFCAYKLSTARFDLKDASGAVKERLEHVPLAISADIYLDSLDTIEVLADGTPLASLDSKAHYEIGITNLCASSTGASDFETHYAALNVGSSAQYRLVSRAPLGDPTPTVLGHCVGAFHDASDRAPCMAVVFGDTEDFVD